MSEHSIYLDHNATTPLGPEVVDAMLLFPREHCDNPSGGHAYGRRPRRNQCPETERFAQRAPSRT